MKENVYLIIHGFAGGIDEIDYLAEYLEGRKLDVHTFLLAGHGGSKKELRKSSCDDWIISVRDVANNLKQEYKNIILLGFSMGGLLSIHFASMPEISKIVFMNTPIYFWNIKIIIKDIIFGIRYRSFDKITYYKKSMFGASIKSGIDFLKLLYKSKKQIKNIKKPTLVVQCVNDESVHYKSAKYIKNNIGSNADLRYYQGGCHQMFNKAVEIRDSVCDDIYQFLISETNHAV